MTGWTIVDTEPEYNDAERAKHLELDEYQAGLHKCGHHVSIVNSADRTFTPDQFVCEVCAAIEQYDRALAADDERLGKRMAGGAGTGRPGDGRETFARLLTPAEAHEAAQTRARARAVLAEKRKRGTATAAAAPADQAPTGPRARRLGR